MPGPDRKRLLASLPGEFLLQDVARDGRVVAERTAQRNEMMARVAGDAREKSLSWLDGSMPADISRDGGLVLFTETGAGSNGIESAYVRRTDGADAVRLGEGHALALSPDGTLAAVRRGSETILLPTGPGQSGRVSSAGVDFEGGATFFPDGRRLLLSGKSAGTSRLYESDVEGGETRAVTSEGISLPEGAHTVSPDGKSAAARDSEGEWRVVALAKDSGASSRPVASLRPGEVPVRWSAEGGPCSSSRPTGPCLDSTRSRDAASPSRNSGLARESFRALTERPASGRTAATSPT
jgi:hypothetical protein